MTLTRGLVQSADGRFGEADDVAFLRDAVMRQDYMSSLPKFFLTLHDMYT